MSDYVRGDIVDILDNKGNIQTSRVAEVGEDAGGKYIIIEDSLQFELDPDNGGRLEKNTTSESEIPIGSGSQTQFSASLSIVNVTPIYAKKDLAPVTLLKPYDIAQVPWATPYDDLNFASQWIQNQIKDIPSIDGNGVIRILPVMEDNLQTVKSKKDKTNLIAQVNEQPPSQLEEQTGDTATGIIT